MGSQKGLNPARVVLDTNTVVLALLFGRGRLAWLREAWQAQRCIPLIGHDTVNELIRVLGYPKFQLTRREQEALLGDFLPFSEVVPAHPLPAGLPAVRDPHDVMFLALAQHARADALVSGDADMLVLCDLFGAIPILTAAEFHEWLAKRR